jgi:hypothetical protein
LVSEIHRRVLLNILAPAKRDIQLLASFYFRRNELIEESPRLEIGFSSAARYQLGTVCESHNFTLHIPTMKCQQIRQGAGIPFSQSRLVPTEETEDTGGQEYEYVAG